MADNVVTVSNMSLTYSASSVQFSAHGLIAHMSDLQLQISGAATLG